ncbi:MAG: class I SAM-dependent methyltransferase [Balneolales bacterium]|nr:class I SAM-dependent methyltransferase [Balneolales bacterium]
MAQNVLEPAPSKEKQQEQAQAYIKKIIQMLQQGRVNIDNEIPKIPLNPENVENCASLLNREMMLQKFGTGGNVAEIGVDEGNFSRKIFEINRPENFHLIDIWGTDRFHDGKYESVRAHFQKPIDEGRVHIHKKYSTEAASDFEDGYFDWIYIDTDHSYKTTRDELHLFAPKVKEGGIIAGHDYVTGNWITTYRYGVIEAVHEFCVQFGWELIYLTIEPTEKQSFAIRKLT